MEIIERGMLMGLMATASMDVWAAIAKHVFRLPTVDWALIGRWFGHMPRGGTDKLTSRLVLFSVYARPMLPPHKSKTQRHVVSQGQASRSKYSIMFGGHQMTPQIEKIVDSSVRDQKPLGLMR
jgi:hypothetical protein